jgi:hypothetical protein
LFYGAPAAHTAPQLVIITALVLTGTSLALGFSVDEYFQQVALRAQPVVNGLRRAWSCCRAWMRSTAVRRAQRGLTGGARRRVPAPGRGVQNVAVCLLPPVGDVKRFAHSVSAAGMMLGTIGFTPLHAARVLSRHSV